MGRIRQIWSAKIVNVGFKVIDSEFRVYIQARLHKDETRVVESDMTPDDALWLAAQLTEYAQRAEKRAQHCL